MTLTVEINHPDYEDGVEFDVAGVLVPNKGKTTLTEDQERLLVARRQKPAREVFEGSQFVKITGSSTLSAKDLEGIIVESNFGPAPEVADEPTTEDTEGSDG
jgi:hypothetical protein